MGCTEEKWTPSRKWSELERAALKIENEKRPEVREKLVRKAEESRDKKLIEEAKLGPT